MAASRNITLAFQTQLLANHCSPILLASLQFADQTVYVWSGVGTISWNGQSWTGVGTLGQISPITEATSTDAQGITVMLSGIPSSLLNESLNQFSGARQAYVYFGFLSSAGVVVSNPVVAFFGQMDQPVIDISGETATITISVENKMADLNRSRGGRYTDADQRARYSGDGGLKYVNFLQDQFINWRG